MARKNTFPKKIHITQNQEFRRIVKTGNSIHSPTISIFYQKEGKNSAFGVSISRKIKGAVFRNRLKRLVREYYRLHQHMFSIGTKMIVYIKHAEKRTLYSTMVRKIDGMVQKSNTVISHANTNED